MIRLKNVSKYYYGKGVVATGFSKVNLEFHIGEFIAITGESGSGKSTLLNVISGLDTYEDGEMYINGEETSHYIAKDFENYRRKNIGNIYQNFNLINSYTVYQNIALALMMNGVKNANIKDKVNDLIKKVDLWKFRNSKVSRLSGGQKQRVAIARALAKDVPILLADEPTGNLDKKSADSIMKLLSELSKDKLVIIVTHNYEQVAPYVTRRITMHDGRVLEDVKIKEIDHNSHYEPSKIKSLSILNRIRLGVRNTFNIIPKFLLLLLVFGFMTIALMSEYSIFKKEETLSKTEGYNYIFNDLSLERIVLNKEDRSSFSKEDLDKISKIDHVNKVIENDYLIDTPRDFTTKDKDYWAYGSVYSIHDFDGKLDYGRMPENEHEAIVVATKDDYYFNYNREETLTKSFYLPQTSGDVDLETEIKFVGVQYVDTQIYSAGNECKFYVGDAVLNKVKYDFHKFFSKMSVRINGKRYELPGEFNIIPSKNIASGEAIIAEEKDYYCEKNDCLWKGIDVFSENLYYKEERHFTIVRKFNERDIASIVNIPNYNKNEYYNYSNIIYISEADYKSMFDKDTYQVSVFVDDYNNIPSVTKELKSMGIHSLPMKDTLVQIGVTQYLRIFKLIITILLVITLFFISYFIIKIILKSRNTYYSIIRMLGGTKSVCRELLMIELMTIANIAYFGFLLVVLCNHQGMIHVGVFNTIYEYFGFYDYIILYLILVGMAFFSSTRYSRKLFKDSVMVSFREEV
ncbi:MAG: ATP-binding cassette domain-containing protein [Bacilli bacterium]|nr:ATP-binding cassette domain-containing protein [Bacilli bacterium]